MRGVVAPLHIISKQDDLEFIDSETTQERLRALHKQELLLMARVLGVTRESYNVFPLADAICHRLYDSDMHDFGRRDDNAPTLSEWCSRDNVHETTVIKTSNCLNNEQASRDHEFRMLQMQLQMEKRKLHLEREKMQMQERLEREKIGLEKY